MSRLGEVEIPTHSRVSTARPAVKEKERTDKAPKPVKQVNVDVYIPSVVTVGNLAKLLNVTLGTLHMHTVYCLNSHTRPIPLQIRYGER